MQKAVGQAVLIGNRLDALGVPSMMADDAQAIRLLMSHLQGAGHRAIGIVSPHPEHEVDQVQIATWRACCARDASASQLQNRLLRVPAARAGLMQLTY